MNTLKKLQSGTDIRGIAMENKEFELTLTEEVVSRIARGFALFLREKKLGEKITIAIGKDSRLSGDLLKSAAINTLIDKGVDVIDCNMATTPAMFMSTIMDEYKVDGAIMITASHLPYYYNGMKFFTRDGGVEKEELNKIIDFATNKELSNTQKGKIIVKDLISDYSKIIVNNIRVKTGSETPLKNLKILVDAGNGAGGFFANKVLEVLGADTSGSQFLEPDGNFPNHIPNPEDKQAILSISNAVVKNNADLGVIFDTDVDRAAIVDKDGRAINKNTLIALISAILLEENPGTTVVTDSITSEGLKEFIEGLGGKHHRFKRGYKNVINEAKRLNSLGEEVDIAIETSGHAALKENYFLDDGAYLVAKILIKLAILKREGKELNSIISNFRESSEQLEFRLNIDAKNFKEYGENILSEIKLKIKNDKELNIAEPNYEGVKAYINNSKSWFLIRISLHEPILAINIESEYLNGSKEIVDKIRYLLKDFKNINLGNLN